MNTLKIPRSVALWIVAFLVTAGIGVSFVESYRALFWWAVNHGLQGAWAIIWPVQIDAFIAVGELALFVALVDSWHWKHRSLPWLIAGAGLAVSVAGNVGHIVTTDVFTRLTAAVPPLTAYVMLAAALGLLKRVVANAPKPVERKKPGPKPGTPKPKPQAATEPLTEERLYRPEPVALAPAYDPDSTQSFPRLDTNGLPVNGGQKSTS